MDEQTLLDAQRLRARAERLAEDVRTYLTKPSALAIAVLALERAGRGLKQAVDQRLVRQQERDLDLIYKGGVFAGMTPQNMILNGEDLDEAIDQAMKDETYTNLPVGKEKHRERW